MTPTGNFQNPPKFGSAQTGPGPSSIADWTDLYKWFTKIWQLVRGVGNVTGTAAQMASFSASNYSNALFFQTDRTVFYQSIGGQWVYVAGQMQCTQGSLPVLGIPDAGFVADVTDYNHKLIWSGTAWKFEAGDSGSAYIQAFFRDPGAGWHLCDGTVALAYLKGDGTLGTVTLPNLSAASAYLKLGPSVTAINPPVAPNFTGANFTPAGTNTAPAFTGSSVTTGNDSGAGQAVQSGAGTTVASHPHTHSDTAAGTNSAPAFTGTPSPVAGSIDIAGEPTNVELRAFFRQ
jgi:hypothetical protein